MINARAQIRNDEWSWWRMTSLFPDLPACFLDECFRALLGPALAWLIVTYWNVNKREKGWEEVNGENPVNSWGHQTVTSSLSNSTLPFLYPYYLLLVLSFVKRFSKVLAKDAVLNRGFESIILHVTWLQLVASLCHGRYCGFSHATFLILIPVSSLNFHKVILKIVCFAKKLFEWLKYFFVWKTYFMIVIITYITFEKITKKKIVVLCEWWNIIVFNWSHVVFEFFLHCHLHSTQWKTIQSEKEFFVILELIPFTCTRYINWINAWHFSRYQVFWK